VIDGATNRVITTITVGDWPRALCYKPTNNKAYCANESSDNVTVIDGATNGMDTTSPVGNGPTDFCHNPAQNRVYVANNRDASISVLHDSGGE
jgi:YVTN family beta-propeller protein